MNANELADFLEKHLITSCAILGDITATSIISTLRQQQAEIEALSKSLSGRGTPDDELANHKLIIQRLQDRIDEQWHMVNKDGYVKPLSDDEIEIMASAFIERATSTQRQECIEFARAIEERHGIK